MKYTLFLLVIVLAAVSCRKERANVITPQFDDYVVSGEWVLDDENWTFGKITVVVDYVDSQKTVIVFPVGKDGEDYYSISANYHNNFQEKTLSMTSKHFYYKLIVFDYSNTAYLVSTVNDTVMMARP